jgi:hypothetical protein
MNSTKHPFSLPPKGQLTNKRFTFPLDGLCLMSIENSGLFSYQLRCIDTDTYYSDKPILCWVKKEFLPFFSYEGRTFSFDFENKSNEENHINLEIRFERRSPSVKNYSFREYTLDGLYMKTLVEIASGKEIEISLTNFRGGHYEIHEIYAPLYKNLSCKINYHNRIIEQFKVENGHCFKNPWILRWPDSAMLYLKNEGDVNLEIKPTEIYFAGYLLKPTKVIEKVAPVNARNTFLIEGIRLS